MASVRIHPRVLGDSTRVDEGDDFYEKHGSSDALAMEGQDVFVHGHSVTVQEVSSDISHFWS